MTSRSSLACRSCHAGWWDDEPRLDPTGSGVHTCPLCGRRLVLTGTVLVLDLAPSEPVLDTPP